MKRFALLWTLGVLLTSCSSVQLQLDYEPSTDFSRYRSYTINPQLQSGLSELDERRVVRLIDSVMQARGFERKLVADLLIDLRSEVYQRPTSPNFGVGMGGTNGNMAGGISVGFPAGGGGLRRAIDIAFFDFSTDRIVWEAQTEHGYRENATPEQREEFLRRVVIKALDAYPPAGKRK